VEDVGHVLLSPTLIFTLHYTSASIGEDYRLKSPYVIVVLVERRKEGTNNGHNEMTY
jgi:hypothetical protein